MFNLCCSGVVGYWPRHSLAKGEGEATSVGDAFQQLHFVMVVVGAWVVPCGTRAYGAVVAAVARVALTVVDAVAVPCEWVVGVGPVGV